jgi:hypothetical protein
LHHLEGVGALTKGAQFGLKLRVKTPDAWLAAAVRRCALSLAKAISIGLRSGE